MTIESIIADAAALPDLEQLTEGRVRRAHQGRLVRSNRREVILGKPFEMRLDRLFIKAVSGERRRLSTGRLGAASIAGARLHAAKQGFYARQRKLRRAR